MIKPPRLEVGDAVGVIAPSDAIDAKYLNSGIKLMESWGLKVKLGKHLFSRIGDFSAGSAKERMGDIRRFVNDKEVKVLWAAEGGYAATEVMPVFDKKLLGVWADSPKWLIGYSDVCILLNALFSFGIVGVHGPNFSGLAEKDERSIFWMKRMLFGNENLNWGSEGKWKPLIKGGAKGILLISNLDSLITTFGTNLDPLLHGKDDLILGLEEVKTEKSIIQRQIDMIINHKNSKRIKGMILGKFEATNEKTYAKWGKDIEVEKLITDRVKRKSRIPLASLDDFGHDIREYYWWGKLDRRRQTFIALPNGIESSLEVNDSGGELKLLESVAGE